MKQEMAETVAARALGWLAGTEELLGVFMGSTGIVPEDLRARAADADFLGSVLDFVLMDDAWVIAFCDASDLAYEQVMAARQALPGGAQVHWT